MQKTERHEALPPRERPHGRRKCLAAARRRLRTPSVGAGDKAAVPLAGSGFGGVFISARRRSKLCCNGTSCRVSPPPKNGPESAAFVEAVDSPNTDSVDWCRNAVVGFSLPRPAARIRNSTTGLNRTQELFKPGAHYKPGGFSPRAQDERRWWCPTTRPPGRPPPLQTPARASRPCAGCTASAATGWVGTSTAPTAASAPPR